MSKPEPVAAYYICSLCGERWDQHGEDPTPETCIRLLKSKPPRNPYTYSISTDTPIDGNSWFSAAEALTARG